MSDLLHTTTIYLRNAVVLVPTVGQIDGGPYLEVEPVFVHDIADEAGIVGTVAPMLSRANPLVAGPAGCGRESWPKPVVLQHAGAKSWVGFARSTLCWNILRSDSDIQICPQRHDSRGRWEGDSSAIEVFPATTAPALIADRMLQLLNAAHITWTKKGPTRR
jgi:hypothetical protein